MKIKTRKQKLAAYNAKYPNPVYDPEKCLRAYFAERNWDIGKATKKAATKLKAIEQNREYETIQIVMYEYPMKTDRPRTFNGHTYSPNAAENHAYFEKAIRKVLTDIRLINTPSEIEIDVYLEMPNRVKPDEVILFESKVLDIVDMPDYDNLGKCYTDLLKNTLTIDDDLFHIGTVRKYYSVLPRVEMRITYLKQHESEYVFKKMKSRKSVKAAMEAGVIDLQLMQY